MPLLNGVPNVHLGPPPPHQNHPVNILCSTTSPPPTAPKGAPDTPLGKPLKLFCIGSLPLARQIRKDFSWFSSVCLRNCRPQRSSHLIGYPKRGPGEICTRMCAFLATSVWENWQIQQIVSQACKALKISVRKWSSCMSVCHILSLPCGKSLPQTGNMICSSFLQTKSREILFFPIGN